MQQSDQLLLTRVDVLVLIHHEVTQIPNAVFHAGCIGTDRLDHIPDHQREIDILIRPETVPNAGEQATDVLIFGGDRIEVQQLVVGGLPCIRRLLYCVEIAVVPCARSEGLKTQPVITRNHVEFEPVLVKNVVLSIRCVHVAQYALAVRVDGSDIHRPHHGGIESCGGQGLRNPALDGLGRLFGERKGHDTFGRLILGEESGDPVGQCP